MFQPDSEHQINLGNSVYAEYSEGIIILRTRHYKPEYCEDSIYIDKYMLSKLNDFVNKNLNGKEK